MRIIDFFDQGVSFYPNNAAFVDETGSINYSDAAIVTHQIAAAIHGHGYKKGTKIGVYSPNSTVAFLSLLGLMRAEGVWLPINPRNSLETNIDLADRFGMSVLFYDSSFNEEIKQIQTAVPGITEFVCIAGEGSIGEPLSSWAAAYSGATHQIGVEQIDDLMALFPSSGTTGKPKGVLMNHKSIETFYANLYSHFNYYENSVHLVVAPMTHGAGLFAGMHFARGGSNVIMAKAEPLAIIQMLDKHKVTHLFLPPTVLYMLLAHPQLKDYDYSSLQHFIVGAAPTSLKKLKEAVNFFGPVLTEVYGQVECPVAITAKAPWDYMRADGTINEERLKGIGRPCVLNTVAILDSEGQEVPRGEAGEICVRGDLVTLGYYENPQATAAVHRHGWHWTGDVGVMAEDGYITIVDRSKDMLISGGFNVYPNEIEQVLTEHPAVQEAAVIGIPDEKWGEAVKAIIQLKSGAEATKEELIAIVKEKLGGVKTPKSVDFIAELPKSAAGKVLKTELRKKYWQGSERKVN